MLHHCMALHHKTVKRGIRLLPPKILCIYDEKHNNTLWISWHLGDLWAAQWLVVCNTFNVQNRTLGTSV